MPQCKPRAEYSQGRVRIRSARTLRSHRTTDNMTYRSCPWRPAWGGSLPLRPAELKHPRRAAPVRRWARRRHLARLPPTIRCPSGEASPPPMRVHKRTKCWYPPEGIQLSRGATRRGTPPQLGARRLRGAPRKRVLRAVLCDCRQNVQGTDDAHRDGRSQKARVALPSTQPPKGGIGDTGLMQENAGLDAAGRGTAGFVAGRACRITLRG